jgi:rare lipoprotein A
VALLVRPKSVASQVQPNGEFISGCGSDEAAAGRSAARGSNVKHSLLTAGAFAAALVAMVGPAYSTDGRAHRSNFSGKASFYSEGPRLANGEKFDSSKLTAAHRTLPFGTRVRVTDPGSGRTVIVIINDRGPFAKERVLDLSLGAAKALGMTERGIISIVAEVM